MRMRSKRRRTAAPESAVRSSGPRTMRECREVVDLLTEYLEGGLAPSEAARLEGHMRGCDACAEFLASLRSVRGAARTPAAEAVPEDCRRALRSFLKSSLKPGKR